MPLKWKLYYWCSLTLMTWAIAMIGLLIYGIIFVHITADSSAVFPIAFGILFAIMCETIFAFRFVAHYKKGTMFGRDEKVFFYILYGVTILISVSSFLALLYNLPKDLANIRQIGGVEICLDAGVVLATASAIYLCIMSPALTAAIRKKYHSTIESIGQHIQP